MPNISCPICESDGCSVFHRVEQIPVYVGAVWKTKEESKNCPRGDVALAYCNQCGFISNVAFDPSLMDYDLAYDNALHFSPFFQEYERSLASRLIDRYAIRNTKVIEIGCGSGHFLGLLCKLGDNRGIGFDPSYRPERMDPLAKGKVDFIKEYYSEQRSEKEADLICCRHVLEHIPDPAAFVQAIRRSLADNPDCILYFEVPNARLILDSLSIWDIMYEHCDYFTTESLGYLFAKCGFDILDLCETYEGQFVSIEVSPAKSNTGDLSRQFGDLGQLASTVERFKQRFAAKKNEWQTRLREMHSSGTQSVVWGAGGKTVGFLNMLKIGDQINYVVDVNPGKQGAFLAGGGQMIVPPESLKEINPDTIIIANPVYKSEILENLHALDLFPQVLTV